MNLEQTFSHTAKKKKKKKKTHCCNIAEWK